MISEFVREQKRYTQNELCHILKCSEEHAIPLIRKLKEFGVLKAVKASDIQKNMADLLEEDIEMVDVEVGENEYFYVFTFVGVIVVAGRVLKCYPKYLLNAKEPTDELRKVIKVLEKYNAKEQIVRMFNDSSESNSFNLLAVLLFLLQDYFENDVYTNTEDIIECNGSGEILWDKTINETFTFLSENRPYYIELQTRKRVTNDFDYFKRLHECLVTMASKELQDAALLDLFEMTGVDLTDEELDDFGDKEYILYRIENELNTQFNTRKQLVLKTMYAYIDRSGSLYDTECLSLFGTNSFNLVWEKICAEIMDNQLDVPLGILKLPVPLKEDYNRRQKLIELIEKPLWTITGKCAKDTLIPDLVSICKVNDQHQFIIFDAKYYNAHLEKGIVPTGQPGIESITKQYLYQLAYQQFIEDHNFSSVKNCFLLPTENNEIEDKGEVRMEMLSNLGLQDIKIRLIPATMAYDLYLSGSKMDAETITDLATKDYSIPYATRIYISNDERKIRKPKQIDNSGIYFEANLSANGIISFIKDLLAKLQLDTDDFSFSLSEVPFDIDNEDTWAEGLIPVAKLFYNFVENLVEKELIDSAELENLKTKEYTKKLFQATDYPAIANNRTDNMGNSLQKRYRAKAINFNGSEIYVSTQFFDSDRDAVIDWYRSHL